MCLAIPGKVLSVTEDEFGVKMARAQFGGIVKTVCLEYTPDAAPGDYILVHVGFALGKVDEEQARRTYAALEELGQLDELREAESEPPLAAGRTPL
jgi:hydrogenase expression/formation protein HypC